MKQLLVELFFRGFGNSLLINGKKDRGVSAVKISGTEALDPIDEQLFQRSNCRFDLNGRCGL